MILAKLLASVAAVTIVSVALVAVFRWSARGTHRASAMGSIMFALSGIYIGKPPPEHFIEQMREPKNRRDGESGDPPESKP